MSLTLRKSYKNPYNGSRIRWKYALVEEANGEKHLISPFKKIRYNKIEWMEAKNVVRFGTIKTDIGFHVFLRKKDIYSWICAPYVIIKVRVKNFLASGFCAGFDSDDNWATHKSETWKNMRILKIYYL